MTSMESSVAIIGAGPVGLFTALLLAQDGIKVTVYESGKGIDQSPRAVAYFPPTLEEFAKAGIVADVVAAGDKVSDGCDWRDPLGNKLAGIDPPPNDKSFAVVLSQPELSEILLRKLLATGNAEVKFDESFTGLKQGGNHVSYWTTNNSSDEKSEYRCQYLVGADGGRSTVRNSLGVELQGLTYDTMQFVAVNFQYPLDKQGWKKATYIVDPVDWGIVVKRGKGNSWRFATGVRKFDDLTELDVSTIQVVKDRLARILPGDTNEIEYESLAPYKVHQRCASRYIEGRVLLAGDAAHLNNPIGGLGLTTGLLDAAHLGKALIKVLNDGFKPSVLNAYAETRRRIFLERTNPITQANLKRLNSEAPTDIKMRKEDFAYLNDKKDFINTVRIGLPDFGLTSTSDRIFDTQTEVTWFISVSKIPEWTTEKFVHEYKGIHADMSRPTGDRPRVIRRYIQLSNSTATIEGTERPSWDYVTCLTFPSMFIVHAGFSDPGYKATAGSHIFCRLDQQGCLATQVAQYTKGNPSDESDAGAVQCLIFHKRSSASDEYGETWFTERSTKWKDVAASDERVLTYTLWRDATPKDIKYFFNDTQFSGGSWHEYKAVEAFHFTDETASEAFLKQHGGELHENAHDGKQTVVGVPDIVI